MQQPVAILMPANVIHVVAMAAWLGGIAVLVFALRAATAGVAPEQRTPLLGTVVGRFSTLAGPALAALILTGVVQSLIEVGSWGALLDTPFGRSVLIKIAVAIVIVALGAYNRQKLVPALKRLTGSPGQTGVLLRRILVAELVLGAIALGVTGALSSYAPSTAQATGKPFSTTVNVGPARVEVTVDPAQVGPNETHVYLFDRETGAPFEGTEELRLTAAMPSKQHRQDRSRAERRRAGPLRRERGDPRCGGRLDVRGDRARLGLQRVRAGLHRPDRGLAQRTVRRNIMKQIAAMIRARIGSPAPMMPTIARMRPAVPARPNAPVASTRR